MEPRSSLLDTMAPDLVMTNGKAITVDSNFSIAQAVAVKRDKIVAVGTNEEIGLLAGKDTRVIDLKGKTLLPGFNDSHCHAAMLGGLRFTLDLSPPKVRSISDVVSMVSEKVKAVQPGEWIAGSEMREDLFEECLKDPTRSPTRWDLDPVSPDNPVYIDGFNSSWVNSKALELVAGINKDTPNPPGGEVIKDPATGEPTGILRELSRHPTRLVDRYVPPLSREQKREAILSSIKEVNSQGVTSITDAGLGPAGTNLQLGLMGPDIISIYNDLYNEGKLTVRVNILYLFGEDGSCSLRDLQQIIPHIGIHSGFGNEWVRISGVKFFADGMPLDKTAWMHEEYVGGGNGSLSVPGETEEERYNELINMILFAHKHGFQVGIHAIGGRAIEACIDGFIRAEREEPRGLRHYVIHSEFITDEYIRLAAEHNIGVSAQPALQVLFLDTIPNVLGEERAARQCPLRTLTDAGVHASGGSDAPVSSPSVMLGIDAAVLRESRETGKVSGPEQRITVEEAIRMFTIEGAWQDHMEDIKGSIEVGKLADLCLLDEDILTIDTHRIKDITVLMTLVGGKIVYNAGVDFSK